MNEPESGSFFTVVCVFTDHPPPGLCLHRPEPPQTEILKYQNISNYSLKILFTQDALVNASAERNHINRGLCLPVRQAGLHRPLYTI
jgi:hypothetical protein